MANHKHIVAGEVSISKIDPNHPLLAVALNCLKDRDVEQPSALELCKLLAIL